MKATNKRAKFTALGAGLVIVIAGVLGFTVWFAYHSQQVANDSLTSANKVSNDIPKRTPIVSFEDCKKAGGSKMLETYPEQCVTTGGKTFTDDTVLKTYISKTEKASFMYPAAWQVVSPSVEPMDGADAIGLRSPDGKVTVSWVSWIGGVGGACDDTAALGTDSACPSSVVTASKAIPGASGLYVVEGYATQDNQKFYPWMAVLDSGSTTSRREMGYELYLNKHSHGENALLAIGGIGKMSSPATAYASASQAKAFLATDDAATARQILLSLTY